MSNISNSGWSDLEDARPEDDEETGFSLDNSITKDYSPRNSVPTEDEDEMLSEEEEVVEEEEEVPTEEEESLDSEEDESEVEDDDEAEAQVETDGVTEESDEDDQVTSRAQKRIIELNNKKKAAEEQARKLQEENARLQAERKKFEKSTLENQKVELEDKVDRLLQLRKKARANEDWDAYDDASDELQEARLGVKIADAKLNAFDEEVDEAPTQAQAQQPQQQSPEEIMANLPETAQSWIKSNPWFTNDPVMGRVAFATTQELESEGFDYSDQSYFDELESRLARKAPTLFGEMFKKEGPAKKSVAKKKAKAPNRKARPQVGSSSKAPTGSKGKGGRKVRLSAGQKQMAHRMGLSVEQYAAEVAKLEAAEKRRAKHSLSPNAWVPMELDKE